jgi:cytochrome bd-type quinol oxidase subunit 1
MMLIANYRGLRHDDADALLLARRWSKVVAVTFAVGAVTGTGALVRVRPAVARVHGPFGEVFGVLFAIEGHLLLPRGDLRRDLHLRVERAAARGRTSGPACRS